MSSISNPAVGSAFQSSPYFFPPSPLRSIETRRGEGDQMSFRDGTHSMRSNNPEPESDTPAAPIIAINEQSKSPLIEFIGVQKSYDGQTLAVANLNLAIKAGEFLTLLGPSGSGKTTTLMMLAGFERPTAGSIFLEGLSLDRLPPHLRNFGVVFQNYALFPHMTVAENIAYPLKVRGLGKPEIADRTRRALEMVKLELLGQRRPSQLSGGQQQRVALARALVFDPKLVLMDEPLGALDKKLREQMQLEIKHLHRTLGITVVYVTHDQGEALTMSDRIAVFHKGTIRQVGTPSEIYDDPTSSFVADFIGENNRLAGEVVSIQGTVCAVRLDDGSCVAAQAVNVAPGNRTILSVRPEKVRVGAAAANCANRMSARLAELIYLGDHKRLELAVGGSDQFTIHVPTDLGYAPGDLITIGWETGDCRALKPE